MIYLDKVKEVIEMIKFIYDLNPLILDTIVVSIFVLIIFFGIIKGIKKTLIDFCMLAGSIFLGFCSYTNSVKVILATKVIDLTMLLPAGSSNSVGLIVSLLGNFLSSLSFAILIYLTLKAIEGIIEIYIKRKRKENYSKKSKFGRVFAGLIALLYNGIIFIVMLLCINNNFIGGKTVIQKSTVAKFVVEKSNQVIEKLNFEEDEIVLKVFKGDFLAEIDKSSITSFKYLDDQVDSIFNDEEYIDILEDSGLTDEEVQILIKDKINDLNNVAILVETIDIFKVSRDEFMDFGEENLTMMTKIMSNRNLEKIKFTMTEKGLIKENLKKAGLQDKVLSYYDEITVGN